MCGQMRSDAVSLTAHDALTSTYIHNQVRYSNVCAVRDEEAAGSNPATPTQVKGRSPTMGRGLFPPGPGRRGVPGLKHGRELRMALSGQPRYAFRASCSWGRCRGWQGQVTR
jgi:hypothetical protein